MKDLPCCQNNLKSEEGFTDVKRFLKLINESNRLKILCFLSNGEKCVCEIWQELGLSQNLASHHLKKLKDFYLIKSRQEGRKIIYYTNKKTIEKYTKLLNKFLISNL